MRITTKSFFTFLGLVLLFGLPIYLASNCSGEFQQAKQYAALLGLWIFLVGAWYFMLDDNALRDASIHTENKPYSFARVQLWWWTVVVLGSFLGVYYVSGKYWPLNATCLVLLGISGVTTAGARTIDNSQANDPNITRHQDDGPSKGLIRDILSDENGLSIHRFQAMVFNLAYGCSFLAHVFSNATNGAFPSYDQFVLGLLGFSSGSYVYMKMNESQTPTSSQQNTSAAVPAQPAQPAAGANMKNDELPDVDGTTVHPADH